MTYAYQQNFYEGASTGYVKFNASPDLRMPVAPGEQITFDGEVYSRDYAVGVIQISLCDTTLTNWVYPAASFPVTAKKGEKKAFKVVFTMPEAADWFPAIRTVPLSIIFSVSRMDGSGDVLTPATEDQQLLWLRYRINPKILKTEFARYRYNEDEGFYEPANDGELCMTKAFKISLGEGYTEADITVARIATGQHTVNLNTDTLIAALSADGYAETDGPKIFSGMTFEPDSSYPMVIEIGDDFDLYIGTFTLLRSFANMCLCNGFKTGGVSFGGFPKSKEGVPLFENYYPARFYGGIENIQAGYIPVMGSTPAGENKDGSVVFARAYKEGTVPVVVIGFKYKSDIGKMGNMGVAVTEVTNVGFDFRFYNNDTGSRNPEFTYIAFGIPAGVIPE